jgi:hypothetical protein
LFLPQLAVFSMQIPFPDQHPDQLSQIKYVLASAIRRLDDLKKHRFSLLHLTWFTSL